jgi:ferredoxin
LPAITRASRRDLSRQRGSRSERDTKPEAGSVRENLDECVLCNLCVEAAPPGGVVVKKLYDGTGLRR